ncbi:reverse transcriptase domain-containing protein [Tanacetum coccineum]
MEPRPEQIGETTPPLRMRSPRVRRQRERVVGFEENPTREEGRIERNADGGRPSELGASENGGRDYPLPDRLKMPSYIGSYDGKGDLDNYLHLFEGAISMQKWVMPVACHMFTYTLKDSARIWWNSQKVGSILNYEELKAKFWSHFNQQKKFTKTHLAVHNIKKREAKSTRDFATRYTDDTLQILGLHEDRRISGFVHRLRTRNLVEFLSTDLPTTYKGKVLKDQRKPLGITIEDRKAEIGYPLIEDLIMGCSLSCLKVLERFWPRKRATFPPCEGNKKGKSEGLRHSTGGGKKDKGTVLVKAPILMISQGEPYTRSNMSEEPTSKCREITFPPVIRNNNSSALVIIKARIFGRQVNRVYMDSGSSCEVIYENCFLKLKPSIKASKVNSNVPLVEFLGEHTWPIGEVPLEIMIGDAPFSRLETLNFVIVRSYSPHNLLLGRTTMQKMGIVVSTIQGAIKFHTTREIITVFSMYESEKVREGLKKVKEASPVNIKGIHSSTNAEERVIVNNK